MPTSREIAPGTWEHVRQCLVYYFIRRGLTNAEDLAQDTLMAVWIRSDYHFSEEEDFLRVCYGFAARICKHGYRDAKRQFLGNSMATVVEPRTIHGLHGAEIPVFLSQVLRAGESRLTEDDWDLIGTAASEDRAGSVERSSPGAANRFRVRLYRARKKLARLTGWDRE